jgi:hypothetical protein
LCFIVDLTLADQRSRVRTSQLRSRDMQKKLEQKKSSKSVLDQTTATTTVSKRMLGPDYDGVVYTLDAKLVGNIGRYFNHSCSPNIAVQNVFVDVSLVYSSKTMYTDHILCIIRSIRRMTFIFHGLDSLQQKLYEPEWNYGRRVPCVDR